jgi:hypothetical protein
MHARESVSLTAGLMGLVLLAAACGGSNPPARSLQTAGPALPATPAINGVPPAYAIAPNTEKPVLEAVAKPQVAIQPGSVRVLKALPAVDHLHMAALKSSAGSVAIVLVEEPSRAAWGSLYRPVERDIIKRFAADTSLGEWLIILADVIVSGAGPDPVPMTASRWDRDQVDQFVKCGIPPATESNDCSKTFFAVARTVVVALPGGAPHGA